MDLTEYRSQFDLHLLVPFAEDYQSIKVKLREKGHSLFHSTEVARFFEEFKRSPSHLVILDLTLLVGPVDEFLAECLEIASQTNFIFIGSGYSRYKYWEYRDYGLLDYVANEDQLVAGLEWAVDNCLERVVVKILNTNLASENDLLKQQWEEAKTTKILKGENSLLEARRFGYSEDFAEAKGSEEVQVLMPGEAEAITESPPPQRIEAQEEDLSHLLGLYENTRNREDLLQVFFHSLEPYCEGGAKVLYFKYLEPVQLLVATHGCGIPVDQIKGAGVKLSKDEVAEAKTLLQNPRGFSGLNKLLADVFHVENCFVKPLMLREDIDGLFVFFDRSLERFDTIHFNNRFSLFRVSFERFSFLKRQLELELEGVLEHIFSYEEFYENLSERIEQLQRHQMGVALLRISLDRLHFIEENFGPTAVTSVIRSLAVTIKKFCRSGDMVYRTALNEFSLLAIHLKPQEATVLAERIRQSMESLDIPPVTGAITISLGVSTYPQLATTAEALMKGSLQALTTVMGQGGNRVGIARAVRSAKVARLADVIDQEQ